MLCHNLQEELLSCLQECVFVCWLISVALHDHIYLVINGWCRTMNPDRSGHFNPVVLAVGVPLHLKLCVCFGLFLCYVFKYVSLLLLMCKVSAGQRGSEDMWQGKTAWYNDIGHAMCVCPDPEAAASIILQLRAVLFGTYGTVKKTCYYGNHQTWWCSLGVIWDRDTFRSSLLQHLSSPSVCNVPFDLLTFPSKSSVCSDWSAGPLKMSHLLP